MSLIDQPFSLSDRLAASLVWGARRVVVSLPVAHETPIEWRLLTNRKVADFAAAAELVDWYRARWEIELFFLVLKQGCRVEALQLSTIQRIEKALALFMIVAWRVARLMRQGCTSYVESTTGAVTTGLGE